MPTTFQQSDLPAASSYWFAKAAINRHGDQADRFIAERFWDHDFEDNSRVLSQVRSMQTGKRIAIQAAYAKKHDLSLETWGSTGPAIEIKAADMIAGILGGRCLRVCWKCATSSTNRVPTNHKPAHRHRGTANNQNLDHLSTADCLTIEP